MILNGRGPWGRALRAALALVVPISLTGCWDQVPITDRAEALVIAAYPVRDGATWHWAYYFPNPAITESSIPQITSSQQVYVRTADAPTFVSSYRVVAQHLSRELWVGQVEDLVWAATTPLRAVRELVDAYNNQGVTPKTAFVAASTGPPRAFVRPSPQEVLPDMLLTKVFNCTVCQPVRLVEREWQFWDALEEPGGSPVVPTMSAPGRVTRITFYAASGQPVIATPDATEGWGYLTGRVHDESMAVRVHGARADLTFLRGGVANRVRWTGAGLAVWARIDVTGMVGLLPARVPGDRRLIRAAQRVAARRIARDCLAVLQRAQKAAADPFGYIQDYLYQHPAVASERPPGAWGRVPYTVHLTVSVFLTQTGVHV
jgi:spore germination protein KC